MTDWYAAADYKARAYVNGWIKNPKTGKPEPKSGEWSVTFRGHPLVKRADVEGWARDLRMHVIAQVRLRIMANQDFSKVEDLMPKDQRWIDYTSQQGVAYLNAKKWRSEQLPTDYWGRRNTRDAIAPRDDSQDRRRPMSVGEAVTRAAQAGFPDFNEGGND